MRTPNVTLCSVRVIQLCAGHHAGTVYGSPLVCYPVQVHSVTKTDSNCDITSHHITSHHITTHIVAFYHLLHFKFIVHLIATYVLHSFHGHSRSNAESDGGQHASATVSKQSAILGKCIYVHDVELFRTACV